MGEPIKGFFEDWEGEIVLSDTKNYESAQEFLKKAQEYVKDTRDEFYPIGENYRVRDILVSDDCWRYVDDSKEGSNIGKKIEVYETDILYDFEYYTFSEKEQDKIDTALKEIEIRVKTDLPDMDIWNIPLLCYKEDLDEYQKAEVRKVFSQKRERGEWS